MIVVAVSLLVVDGEAAAMVAGVVVPAIAFGNVAAVLVVAVVVGGAGAKCYGVACVGVSDSFEVVETCEEIVVARFEPVV